ncbi:hypothetical protein R3P38DRAFT_3627681 [Favolaschia claudopus]|uniref:Uncharacterized protein n=1 Tax=Favolaschia claudopus TaxID=2862362 RepID=A0AAV9ZZM0_9AGAR
MLKDTRRGVLSPTISTSPQTPLCFVGVMEARTKLTYKTGPDLNTQTFRTKPSIRQQPTRSARTRQLVRTTNVPYNASTYDIDSLLPELTPLEPGLSTLLVGIMVSLRVPPRSSYVISAESSVDLRSPARLAPTTPINKDAAFNAHFRLVYLKYPRPRHHDPSPTRNLFSTFPSFASCKMRVRCGSHPANDEINPALDKKTRDTGHEPPQSPCLAGTTASLSVATSSWWYVLIQRTLPPSCVLYPRPSLASSYNSLDLVSRPIYTLRYRESPLNLAF